MALSTYISLFSGGGGLDRAIRSTIPQARAACYVEVEAPAVGRLASRMAKGELDEAPVWSDITRFRGKPWRGLVDGIIGGFPCVDLSVAGKRAGILRGNRSGLWYEYVRIIREVRPWWIAIENVPPVLHLRAGRTVFRELARLGFDAEWRSLRASDVGAPHQRKRVFIFAWSRMADAENNHWGCRVGRAKAGTGAYGIRGRRSSGCCIDMAHSEHQGPPFAGTESRSSAEADHARRPNPAMADAGDGLVSQSGWGSQGRNGAGPAGPPIAVGHAHRPRPQGRSLCGCGCRDERAAGAAGAAHGGMENSDVREPEQHARCRPECGGSNGAGPRGQSSGSGELSLFPPGPGDAEAWQRILAEYPLLAPALSKFDVFVHFARRAGVLPLGVEGTPSAVAKALRQACVSPQAQSALRGVADELADWFNERTDSLRMLGNGVVEVQAAVAIRELMRRAGLMDAIRSGATAAAAVERANRVMRGEAI